ncbi:MAG: hypothetical protein WAU86_14875 [Oricola sp.]
MSRPSLPLALATAFLLPAVPASACQLLLDADDGPEPARLSDIGPGIAAGMLQCGRELFPAQVWTLEVDPAKPELGVRDGKLFDTRFTGPLTELVSAKIASHARVSVQERSETVAMSRSPMPEGRNSFRRIVTFCDLSDSGDPLDCSLGAARVKARSTAEDADRDGYLDLSTHEISFYDGASKLHVMSFVTPWEPKLTTDMAHWIDALNAVSDVLKPRKLALAD